MGAPAVDALVPLGGSSALALLGRGRIWRTDDGGTTWSEVAQAPRLSTLTTASTAALGPDGRLYVAMFGGDQGWVYRTAEVLGVPVAGEAEPGGSGRLRLEVAPNPSGGTAPVVRLTLGAAVAVEAAVYDALGRRVAVLHAGALGAGTHALAGPGALAPGVYVVRATAGGEAVTTRLVVRP